MHAFLKIYRELNHDTLHLLDEIYDADIHFVDPVHELSGLEELRRYFGRLYGNIKSIDFDFFSPLRNGSEGYVHWEMRYSHPNIGRGRMIEVHGASYLRFTPADKVHYHRDFFDLGNMLYQHLPVLGPIIKTVNRRLGS